MPTAPAGTHEYFHDTTHAPDAQLPFSPAISLEICGVESGSICGNAKQTTLYASKTAQSTMIVDRIARTVDQLMC
jgi:hypothetical protein